MTATRSGEDAVLTGFRECSPASIMTRDEVTLVQGADARSRLEEVMAEVPADGVVEVTARVEA